MPDTIAVGFIGFGEAGFIIAKGLREAGLERIFFCHLNRHDPQRAALAAKRGREAGAAALDSAEALVARSDYLLSVVPPDAAVAAAEEYAPFLGPGKVYIDLTSSSPETMKAAARKVEATGAFFVDGALMGPVPAEGHRVLTFVSGARAEAAAATLNRYGMNLRSVGPEPGQASAIKLIVSIATKGFGGLLIELLLAAHHFRVEETVLKVLNDQFFGRGLEYVVDRFVGSDAVYARRRAVEMAASLSLLEQLGIDPLMVRATVERLKWSASLGLSAKFGGVPPAGYREVIRAWEEIGLFDGEPHKREQ
jgi:3-hydroxyisobutyrate dehydrogenase-like beta-hydroxyacid dehydrogenase